MKLKLYSFKKEKRVIDTMNKPDRTTAFENLLFCMCIVCFLVLIAVQVVMANPSIREKFNLTDKSIGLPLNDNEFLYNQGQITLRMIGDNPDPTLKILVNGDEAAIFENTQMSITVRDGDVIEIDGSQSLLEHIIKIESVSANISPKCSVASVNVHSNIKKLVKVQIN